MLRRTFGPEREEVTGGWRRLHCEELRNLYASPNIIRAIKSRKITWAGLVERMRNMRNAYNILFGKREGKRPLGKPRRKWEDNIRMDLRKIEWESADWINLTQDRNTILNLWVP
jgi:hypothetical protein